MPDQVRFEIDFTPAPATNTEKEQAEDMAQGLAASINTEASQTLEGQINEPGVHCWYEEMNGRWYLICE